MGSKEVQEIYSKRIRLYHWLFFNIMRYHKAVLLFFRESAYLHNNCKILDAGCGSGLITKTLYALSAEKNISGTIFHAFDITNSMLSLFKKWVQDNSIKNIEVRRADALKLKLFPEYWAGYDLIVSSAMLEYLPKDNMGEALCGLRGMLKSSGTILIFITKRDAITNWLVGRWWKANTCTQNEIKQVAAKAGFRRIRFRKFPNPYAYFSKGMLIMEAKKN